MDASYKILLMMKRRPGMSVEAFRAYYETHHVPLVSKYASGVRRYLRRYIDLHVHPETGDRGELPFDVRHRTLVRRRSDVSGNAAVSQHDDHAR